MSFAAMLSLALVLDAIFGEPDILWRRVPHPTILMGRLVSFLDSRLNRGSYKKTAGILTVGILIISGGIIGYALTALPVLGPILSIIGAAILLAHRSLIEHVREVETALSAGLEPGRKAVSMIVGRDPETLDQQGVARAAIESAAENFSDGVIAPAFCFLIAGLPGIMIYKLVNTADSMIGHRSEKYCAFGWAAARLDDLMNFIPARLTGVLIAYRSPKAMRIMLRDARLHQSPNAGWPESAMAGILNIALAGPRQYEGVLTDDPWLNAEGDHQATPEQIGRACDLLNSVWIEFLAIVASAAALGWLLF